eukprot:6576031-Prymnesium_polylepis.1
MAVAASNFCTPFWSRFTAAQRPGSTSWQISAPLFEPQSRPQNRAGTHETLTWSTNIRTVRYEDEDTRKPTEEGTLSAPCQVSRGMAAAAIARQAAAV